MVVVRKGCGNIRVERLRIFDYENHLPWHASESGRLGIFKSDNRSQNLDRETELRGHSCEN